MDYSTLIREATIHSSDVYALTQSDLLSKISDKGAVVIRGLADPAEIIAAKNTIKEQFDVENDHAATGETPEDLYSNFQKFSVNGGDFRDKAYAQCLRTYYNPLFAEDMFGMHGAFRMAGRIRNLLMGVDLDFALEDIADGFWTAARIHQYPRGGGFMAKHCEDYIPKIYEQHGFQNGYYQPLIVMSKRGDQAGCDYETGGGYFCIGEERVYFEEYCEIGDILVYDTRVMHGVEEVDLAKPFRQPSVEGRYAAFVTLYRDLRS